MEKTSEDGKRRRVAIVLVEPSNYDLIAFKYFTLALNQEQKFYEFSFPDIELKLEEGKYTEARWSKIIESTRGKISPPANYVIAISTSGISGNFFFLNWKDAAVITTDVWEKYFSPPSLFEYLLHCMVANLLMSDAQNNRLRTS